MSYVPTFVPEVDTLGPSDLTPSGVWVRVSFHKIRPGDRILVVRTANGARQTVESTVEKLNNAERTWSNAFGAEIVFPMDTDIFRLQDAHDGRFPEDSESVLGG